jgi:hypothetical protein
MLRCKKILKPFVNTFFARSKESIQRKGAPGVSRPPAADSLAGHILKGSL